MAHIRPFRGYRPVPEFAEEVAALPYDVLTFEEAAEIAQEHPYSFLHVDKAEIDLPFGTDPYDQAVYEKAYENLNWMISQEIYIQDEIPCYYLYRQTLGTHSQMGLVVSISVEDYLDNQVKKHELTRWDKEKDRICHVDVCSAHTGPVFIFYRHHEGIRRLLNGLTEKLPVYQFTSVDYVKHEVWVIKDPTVIEVLTSYFSEISSLYIADGHHRAAAAVQVAKERRRIFPNYRGEEFNFFLAALFPEDELTIFPYNRLVKDLNGLTPEDFLKKVEERFTIQKLGKKSLQPQYHQFGMRLQREWYLLTVKAEFVDENDPIKRLDVTILQNNLLQPFLGIVDPRADSRIDFVGGIYGEKELERRTEEDMILAFQLHAVCIEELMSVADKGEFMPPKSTWFEPKLLSGLFIHMIEGRRGI